MTDRIVALFLILLIAGGISRVGAEGTAGTWNGLVTDELCAKNGLAQDGDAVCPKDCVTTKGSKYALYIPAKNPAEDKVYILNPQDKAAALAGKRVTIKGTLEGDTITVTDVSVTPKK